jgi:hypothetical protein
MQDLDSCRCWRCTFFPCKARSRFIVNFWNRTIRLLTRARAHTHTHTHTNQGSSSHGQDTTELWEASDLHNVAAHSYTFARDNPPHCMHSAQWARTRNVRVSFLKKETEGLKTYLDVLQIGYFTTRKFESKRVGHCTTRTFGPQKVGLLRGYCTMKKCWSHWVGLLHYEQVWT